jgi:hypothetical protein
MALQPNGHGLNEGAADPWNLPPSHRTQQNEPAGIAGRASAAKFDVWYHSNLQFLGAAQLMPS